MQMSTMLSSHVHKLVADTFLVRINCIWKFNKQI